MTAFIDLLSLTPSGALTSTIAPSQLDCLAAMIQIAQANGLDAQSFLPGDPSSQWLQASAMAVYSKPGPGCPSGSTW